MRKLFTGIAFFAVLLIAFVILIIAKYHFPIVNGEKFFSNQKIESRSSEFFEYKSTITSELSRENSTSLAKQMAQVGVTSHHLPTALPLIADFYRALKVSEGPRDVFVILGPDHREGCRSLVSLTDKKYLTPFGELAIDEKLISKITNYGGGVINEQCFDQEHAIGVQTIFIKYFFPEAKIVPILFSSAVRDSDIDKLLEVLLAAKDKITIVASVDFSHHHIYSEAQRIDEISQQMISRGEWSFFDLEHVDSPMALKIAMRLAGQWQMPNTLILERANSFEFNKNPQDTTGYLTAIFAP